jgi:peptide/nickel transport system substrate-binding protein
MLACVGLCLHLGAATRPHYGGTLHVEIRESMAAPEPPLVGGFAAARWEPGKRAAFAADQNAAGGRPFLDAVEIEMARPLREQSIDLEVGKADLVELGPSELRRQPPGRRVWSSAPVRVIALVFGERIEDARVREALALAVDRAAIHNVLLQRQGEVSGALLPQWLSGYAFVFAAVADAARARGLASAVPVRARSLTLGVGDPGLRPIAERIALNASRDAGLGVSLTPSDGADVRLVELRIASADPARALAALAASVGAPEPPRADSLEALYAAERALLEGFRVIPLFHLPEVYGAGPRVRGGPAITPLGEWRFDNLWLEGGRP